MNELQSIDELEFVAECKETGERLAFTMADLYGWDDETVFLDTSIYLERLKERNWAIVCRNEFSRTLNPKYNIHLRTEEDVSLIEPLQLLSIKLYSGYRFEAVFSNYVSRSSSFLPQIRRYEECLEECVTEKDELSISEDEFGSAVMCPRGIRLQNGVFISTMELWKASSEC